MSQDCAVGRELPGRDGDVRRVEQFVASLATAGSVLLVTGEPGVGKSALLDVAENIAAGQLRVLRCAGVEFEVEVAYSGLHQALRPLRAEIRRLDETPRAAIQVALGLSVAAPHEPLIVSNAVLELLERAAAERPLLIIVDDAQWLDRATAFTLAFVARRLTDVRLGLLVAARSGADSVFQSLRVARHELTPLTPPTTDATPGARLHATVAAATLLFEGSGEVATAHRMLVSGIEAHTGSADSDDDAVQGRRQLEDAQRLGGASDSVSLTWLTKAMRALLAAVEGDDDLLAALDEEGLDWAGPRQALGVLHALHHAVGLGALGRGHYDMAFRRLALISPPGTLAPHAPRALATCMDLVEAAVRSGRLPEAKAHAAVLDAAGVAAISPRLALLVAASAALVEEDDAVAVAALDRALLLPEIEDWPFDHARVQLALGERLRRGRSPTEARTLLRAALTTFERIGARPWAERARAELAATSETRTGPGDGPHPELTAQERQVAELAASGLTNREIGARLYLSHRTVGSHLHHVFPKLGISSRAALRDALNRRQLAGADL